MQAHLIFSPFAFPGLPLGPALLKSYAETYSEFQVTCFDLNITWHHLFVEAVKRKETDIREEDLDRFLKGLGLCQNDEGFFNQAVYNQYVPFFFRQFMNRYPQWNEACKEAVLRAGRPAPSFMEPLLEPLLINKPNIVGFSIMHRSQYYFSVLAARIIRAFYKDIRIIFGGNFCTLAEPQFVLAHDFIDYIVCHEGEEAFLRLLMVLNGEAEIEQVPNLSFKKGPNIISNHLAPIKKIDQIPPPDFSDMHIDAYFNPAPVTPVLGSRGCYWRRCTFCAHHKSYMNQYRTKSVSRFVDELEDLAHTYGIRYFYFADEMISPKRFKRIAEEIIARRLKVNYCALAKPVSGFTQEVFKRMYQSGCRYIMWGVESGCQRVLDLQDKGTKVMEMARVLKHSASACIFNHVFIIIGFPTETEDELRETIDFLYANREYIHQVLRGTFTLRKGSIIYEQPEAFGINKINEPRGQGDEVITKVDYEVKEGLSAAEAQKHYESYVERFFKKFSHFSASFGTLREHALLIYSNQERIIYDSGQDIVPAPNELEKV